MSKVCLAPNSQVLLIVNEHFQTDRMAMNFNAEKPKPESFSDKSQNE